MRRGVLEFYLQNHPLDCPICDQSGECKLQDYVHRKARKHGRSREPKRVFGRDDFGGDVLFYGDRCVMCTRCVRFMNEMAQDPRLTVVEGATVPSSTRSSRKASRSLPTRATSSTSVPSGRSSRRTSCTRPVRGTWTTPLDLPELLPGVQHRPHTARQPGSAPEAPGEPRREFNTGCAITVAPNYEWMNRQDRRCRSCAAAVRATEGTRTHELAGCTDAGRRWPPDGAHARAARSGTARHRAGGVKAVASPFASNEDLAAFRRLVRRWEGRVRASVRACAARRSRSRGSRTVRAAGPGSEPRGAEILGMQRSVGDDAAREGWSRSSRMSGDPSRAGRRPGGCRARVRTRRRALRVSRAAPEPGAGRCGALRSSPHDLRRTGRDLHEHRTDGFSDSGRRLLATGRGPPRLARSGCASRATRIGSRLSRPGDELFASRRSDARVPGAHVRSDRRRAGPW
jgi:hypothetical protein